MRFSFLALRCNRRLLSLASSRRVKFLGGGIRVVQHYPAKFQELLNSISDFRSPPQSTPERHFSRTKTLRGKRLLLPALSMVVRLYGKVTGISRIGYYIQIDRIKISQDFVFQGFLGSLCYGVSKMWSSGIIRQSYF
ncbi:hypothetical protein TNCV_2923101 [Trichonephila clavipes]|nr:hypothetical protein TNCV_2923101 [Trichonephila clavipes]